MWRIESAPMAHVLIVDDEPLVLDLLETLLERMGHRVTRAEDGAEAILRFQAFEPDVIVADVVLPRVSGFDLFARVLPRIRMRVPFVFLSAYVEREGVQAAINAGAFDYLAKPFREAEMRDVVDRALEQRARWLAVHERGPRAAAAGS